MESIFYYCVYVDANIDINTSPIIMQKVVDEYIPNKDIIMIIVGILLFVVIPLLQIVFQMVFNYFSIKIARNIGNEISIKITQNLINQKLSFFHDENSVKLVTNSSTEASGYINFYVSELPKYYAYIFISVIIILILFYYSPYLALIQLLFFPFAILPINKIGKSLEMEIQKVLTNNAKIAQLRTDIFKGIDLVKSLKIEDKKINEVRGINSNTASIWGKVTVLDATTGIWISGFLSKLFIFITFGVGAFLLINQIDNLSVGSLISNVSYIGILYGYMDALFRMQIDRKKQDAEFSRLQQYIDLPGEVEQNLNKKEVKFIDKIEFKNAKFKYPKSNKVLFENLNISLNVGQ